MKPSSTIDDYTTSIRADMLDLRCYEWEKEHEKNAVFTDAAFAKSMKVIAQYLKVDLSKLDLDERHLRHYREKICDNTCEQCYYTAVDPQKLIFHTKAQAGIENSEATGEQCDLCHSTFT